MSTNINRRHAMAGTGASFASLLAGLSRAQAAEPAGAGEPFSFEGLVRRAAAAARVPYQAPAVPKEDVLAQIDYDAYQKIRFRDDRTIRLDKAGNLPVQLFHVGTYFREPGRFHVVVDGRAREVTYDPSLFDIPPGHVAHGLGAGSGFAGFRMMAPNLKGDWISFLGASYFRTSGPFNQYGLSARGLSIDTGLSPEEFPRFSEFWLEARQDRPEAFTTYALLDSPRVSGAYRIATTRSRDTRGVYRIDMEIEAELFARKEVTRLGIAPFSSMFWYGEGSRRQSTDWRPEIHDSDGVAIFTGSGERIWRPLNNPPRVMTNTFVDHNIRGFGLLQRDRDFVHYLDDGVFYERRASVWVEPLEAWGPGALHLLEIPTDDEIHDNIALYWCPEAPFRAGDNRRWRYRLSWVDDIPFPDNLARSTGTWNGLGGRPGQKRPKGVQKFVIDWQGPALANLGRPDNVEIVVSVSRGTVPNAYTHPVVDQQERWRALFDVEATGEAPVDLRAFLKKGDRALTETWIYQYFPEA